MIKPETWAILSATSVNKKATIPTTILKSQEISDAFGNLYVNNWKENRRRIGIDTLNLLSRHLQRLDRGFTEFRKQSQYNQPSFWFTTRPQIWKTNIEVQKINGTTLETYEIILSIFFVLNKDDKVRFFEENFLWTDIMLDVILKMLF